MFFRTLPIVLVLTFLLPLGNGCSYQLEEPIRESIPAREVSVESADFASVPGLLDQFSGSSCEQLDQLASQSEKSGFQFFQELTEVDNVTSGKVSLLNSPFLQLALLQEFYIPTPAEALSIAEEDYFNSAQTGEDDLMWTFTQCFYHIGMEEIPGFNNFLCSLAGIVVNKETASTMFMQGVYDAVNEEVGTQFPGIFGEVGSVEGSLFERITRTSGRFNRGNELSIGSLSSKTKGLLKTSLPYLQGRPSKSSFKFTVESSKSILSSFYKSIDEEERACAMTLGYYQFSEWIQHMGLERPTFLNEEQGDPEAFLSLVDENNQELNTKKEVGLLVNTKGEKVSLTQEELEAYDPEEEILLPVGKSGQVLNFQEMISLMYSQLATFVLTSPAEEWVKSDDLYLLGDVNSPAIQTRKVFPSEMHSLSLGLLSLNMLNLAVSDVYLREINSSGRLLESEESAAGIIFGPAFFWKKEETKMSLEEVISLAHFAIDASISLERLAEKSVEELQQFNAIYTETTYQRLFDLEDEDSALSLLKELHLGVTFLLLEFVDAEGACSNELQWNFKKGEHTVGGGSCSGELRNSLKEVLERLAKRTRSEILLQRSREL